MELSKICSAAVNLVKETGQYIRDERQKMSSGDVAAKGKHDYVTVVDKGAEEKLVHGLAKLLPEAGFIAEEGTSTKRGEEYNWIIDPIDGTTNFIHGCPPYAISVALTGKEESVIGIVYEVALNECFYTYKGAPAYLNGKEIKVSQTDTVEKSLIATGFPYNNFDRLRPFMESLEYFFVNTHGVRRLGSAATDLAYVACGRYDSFYEYNLSPWDVAAGAFLVKQAGGIVSDFKGNSDYLFSGEIVASNEKSFAEFQQKVGQFMNTR